MAINNKILCVDDEVHVLDAFRRTLRKDFDVSVAVSGEQALSMLKEHEPFAVVLSDMRMPGMNGIQLLSQIRKTAPETVRIMLTGNSDQQTAIDAVNEGSIFRFLNKPCSPEALTAALNAGVEQHRLVTAEKLLLEQTLNQSIQVLLDILSIVNPTAFSRAGRIKKLARDLGKRLSVSNLWEIEFAAMLSQIGCVTVPEEILQKVLENSPLSNKETGLFNQHPQIAYDLVIRIPRMENVADIIAAQNRRFADEGTIKGPSVIGSRILKTTLDYDKLISDGHTPHNALGALNDRSGWYDPTVLAALQVSMEASVGNYESVLLKVAELEPGMFLDTPLVSLRGSTLLPSGQEITSSLILRLANLVDTGILADQIRVNAEIAKLATATV